MTGMLLEFCEGNAEDNGSMWKTLKCFACSLHCLVWLQPQHSCIDNVDKLERAGLKRKMLIHCMQQEFQKGLIAGA